MKKFIIVLASIFVSTISFVGCGVEKPAIENQAVITKNVFEAEGIDVNMINDKELVDMSVIEGQSFYEESITNKELCESTWYSLSEIKYMENSEEMYCEDGSIVFYFNWSDGTTTIVGFNTEEYAEISGRVYALTDQGKSKLKSTLRTVEYAVDDGTAW